MNPRDEKEKWEEYTFLHLFWENIFISSIPRGVKNGCNESYQKSKPSILFLTSAKRRCEGKNRRAPFESYPHQMYAISFQNLLKHMTIHSIP